MVIYVNYLILWEKLNFFKEVIIITIKQGEIKNGREGIGIGNQQDG